MPRRSLLLPFVALCACLAVLPACKKKPSDDGGGGGGDPAPGGPPAAVSSDYILYAHLNAKDIRDSAIFAEVKQAFAKAGGSAEWDKVETEAGKAIGVKPTDVEAVTVCVTEIPDRGEPKMVMILAASKPIEKANAFGLGTAAKADARGFYTTRNAPGLIHFPDDKTVAVVSPDLAQKYLDGYAKNRTDWPLTAELSKAAAGHTLFVAVNMGKLPAEARTAPDLRMFAPLLAAKSMTVTADLKGKELSVAARGTFPDADAAGKAKDLIQGFVAAASGEVEKVMNGKDAGELKALMPAVKEAHRTLKAVKLEVSGSDLTLAGSYKADFDIPAVVADAVARIREAAARMTAQNNLKQIGIALHSYADAYQRVPVHAVGAKGTPLRNPTDKPLLSWRVAVLPFIEQDNLYKQFKLDEPWDSEHNKKLIDKMPKIYAPVLKPGKAGYTHLQMAVGPNAMRSWGMAFPGSFQDGLSNTLAVAEAAEPVIWTKPDDIMLSSKELPKELTKKFGGQFRGGFNVLLWDGSVRFVRDTISEKTLGHLVNPADGMILGSDW